MSRSSARAGARARSSTGPRVLGCLALALLAGAAAAQDALSARAVHMAYRLDLELGPVDAAQRHALVARLLLARESGALGPGTALETLWLGWEAALEELERSSAVEALPAWHEATELDAVEIVVARAREDLQPLWWPDPLWGRGEAAAALRILCSGRDPVLAAAVQPRALAWARSHAPEIWRRLLAWLEREPEWQPLVEPLLLPALALSPSAPVADWEALGDPISAQIRALLEGGAVDALTPLRAAIDRLLDAGRAADRLFGPGPAPSDHARFLAGQETSLDHGLRSLARATGGLEGGAYAEFVGSLLQLTVLGVEAGRSFEAEALLLELERLDPLLLELLPRVDTRLINVYQRLRQILRLLPAAPAQRDGLLLELADLDAVVGLDTPDLGLYLAQPVRDRLREELRRCFRLSAGPAVGPPRPISDIEYDGCLTAFEQWALEAARDPALAGQGSGPFESEQLLRESRLSPWQRVNYWLGYLEPAAPRTCALPRDPLVNPLEWSIAARALRRFVDRWPSHGGPEVAGRVAAVAAAGRRSMGSLAELAGCLSPSRPLLGAIAAYAASLDAFTRSLGETRAALRSADLTPGADIDLGAGPGQTTGYRPEGRNVQACDGRASCGMAGELAASKALFGLFPEVLLIGDQVQLGRVELCYRDVSWVERRAEVSPTPDRAMARYFGRLSFVLEGRYTALPEPVFAMRMVSPDEYEYLFGANDPEVLDDPCPRKRVDARVQAELPARPIELVPRRLTYMTAERTQPGRLLEANWAGGQEWRDRFVTGRGVELLARGNPGPALPAIAARLQALDRRQEQRVYGLLLAGQAPLAEDPNRALTLAMRRLETDKQVVAAVARVLLAGPTRRQAALRASLYGADDLFDRSTILRLQQREVPADALAGEAARRLAAARQVWEAAARAPRAPGSEADRLFLTTLLELDALGDRLRSASLAPADIVGDQ